MQDVGVGGYFIFLPLETKISDLRGVQGRRGQEQGLCLLRFQATGLCMVMRLPGQSSVSVHQTETGSPCSRCEESSIWLAYSLPSIPTTRASDAPVDDWTQKTAAGSGFNMTTSRHTHLVLKSFSRVPAVLFISSFFKCFEEKSRSLPGKL